MENPKIKFLRRSERVFTWYVNSEHSASFAYLTNMFTVHHWNVIHQNGLLIRIPHAKLHLNTKFHLIRWNNKRENLKTKQVLFCNGTPCIYESYFGHISGEESFRRKPLLFSESSSKTALMVKK